MAVNLSPLGGVGAQFFDNSGNPLTGGKIYTYAAGTTTNQATYTSSSGSIAHSNPIILDAAGRVPGGEIWLTDGLSYKFVLKTSTDTSIATYDNIVGINSNFVNYTNQQEIQTATAGQTVFTLATMTYQPGTGSLSVFVDGVNQYGPGAQYAFVETDSTTVTFVSGLHVGASVKFTTSAINAASYGDAFQISYTPPFTGSVATNVGDKLAQTVSVKDFGAVGDGVADDTAAIQAAINYLNPYVYSSPFNYQQGGGTVFLPRGMYRITDTIRLPDYVTLQGQGRSMWLGADRLNEPADGTIIFADFASTSKIAIDSAGYDTATGLRYTALTPRPNADYINGDMTYTHGVGIKELAVKCNETTPIEVGIRLNGSPLSMMQDVAVWGFKTGYLSVACWCNEYNNIIGVNKQIGLYMGGNNGCKVTGILDNVGLTTGKYSGFGGTDVTALNKPIWWSASDAIYCSTSIYLDGCRSIAFPEMTSQNGGRGLYANNSNFSFGTWYTEGYPFNADSTGVVNGADSKGVFSNWYHDSNGCTLLQHNYNFPITILALSGIYGLLQGVDGNGPDILGYGVERNQAFPDIGYDTRFVYLTPSTGSVDVSGSLTNVYGTVSSAVMNWVQTGNVFNVTLTITGTGIYTTNGIVSTPFTGTGNYPLPAQDVSGSLATIDIAPQVGSCYLKASNYNLYLSNTSSTTKIVANFTMTGV